MLYGEIVGKSALEGEILRDVITVGGGVSEEIDPTVPSYVKEITEQDIQNWNSKASQEQLVDYVKNTDYVTSTKAGLAKIGSSLGIWVNAKNELYVAKASDSEIDTKTSNYKPIVPASLDYAVKVGLTTNTETLTDEEKANAQKWLGVPQITATQLEDGSYSLSITTPTEM